MRQLLLSSVTIVALLFAPRPLPAQEALTQTSSQYTADWSQAPGFYLSGPMWDQTATFAVVYSALPSSVVSTITSSNTAQSFAFWQTNFQDVLRKWAFNEMSAGIRGAQLAADSVAFLDQVYANVGPQLAQLYPGYPPDVYKALTVQNLVHAYHTYATSLYYETVTGQIVGDPNDIPILVTGQLTMADELASLIRTPAADCGEISELVRVMARLWGLDMRYVGIDLDYPSPFAAAEVQSTHSLDVLVYTARAGGPKYAVLVDALINQAIAPGPLAAVLPGEMTGDGILAATSYAGNRYAALSNAHKVLRFFDYYMHPPVREGYLKAALQDASLTAFMYVYYLEAYPNANITFSGSSGWQVNSQAFSVNQPAD